MRSIPEDWEWTTLGKIASIKGGLTKGKKRRPEDQAKAVPYLRVANVQRGHIDLTEVKKIDATDTEIAELQLRLGDVLLNEGGDRDKLGRGWVWGGQLPLCIHQNHVFRARLDPRAADPKFVSYYANSHGAEYFYANGKHTTNLASINLTLLSQLPLPLPPLVDQRRIVAEIEKQFTRIDAAVSTLGGVETKLRRFCVKILDRATAEKAEWTTVKLGDLASEVRNGISTKPAESEGLPILRINSVRPMSVSADQVRFLPSSAKEEYGRYLLRYGDLLFTRYNGNPEFVGVAGMVRTEEELVYPDKLIRFRLPAGSPVSPDFLEIAVNSGMSRAFLRGRVRTTAGQAGISGADIKSCPVAFPPSHDQQVELVHEVQRALTQANATAAAVAANIRRSERLKTAILRMAFDGTLIGEEEDVVHV